MRKLTGFLALTFVLLLALPAFADRRVAVEGRVRSFTAEREGYRVYLERSDYSFWIPNSLLGRRSLRVGAEVRVAGVYRERGRFVSVDDFGWREPERVERYEDLLSGRVERVNYREERLVVRDERGRMIDVDTRVVDDRHPRLDIDNIHRGDRITLRGRWDHGMFRAVRVESIRGR
ncbi:MAG TPA: hypothetical protein VG323_13955 [Thermoanaerobaculia bacterium]|nr:hypothetical protein [Thermoanaerobaculia bacterium]